MPCHSAIIDKPLTVSPDDTVGDVLSKMKKAKADYAVVTEGKGVVAGVFSHRALLKNLLPVNVPVTSGFQIDVNVKAAPGIAKRLKKVMEVPVAEVMERKMNFVRPETPLWEGVAMLVRYGSPVVVVKDEGLKFIGLITSASMAEDLQKLDGSEG